MFVVKSSLKIRAGETTKPSAIDSTSEIISCRMVRINGCRVKEDSLIKVVSVGGDVGIFET